MMPKQSEAYQSSYNSSVYSFKSDMKFVNGTEVYDINSINIKSIAIDYNYKNMNMPMVFCQIAIDRKLADKMIQHQDTGKIIFNLSRAVINSDMPDMYTKFISDEFIYFIANDINKSSTLDYGGENAGRDDIFINVSIGLLCLSHVNNNKKVMNGVLSGKLSSVMCYLTSHLPILIEPPIENKKVENLFLPPMNSISKALDYLNSIQAMYKTPYRFFIDFGCSYLISSSGKPIKKKNDKINSILLNLTDAVKPESKTPGMIIDKEKGMYQIDFSGTDCELSDSHAYDKSFAKVSATTTSGDIKENSLSNVPEKSDVVKKTKIVRIKNDNQGILDNMTTSLDSSSIQILVQKADIDSTVLTMNKEYILKADEVYKTSKYNGRYILTRKRELYLREDEDMQSYTMLLLEKVAE